MRVNVFIKLKPFIKFTHYFSNNINICYNYFISNFTVLTFSPMYVHFIFHTPTPF